ncbi:MULTISPECIES: signal recognition particle-docking protein FtsY [Gordonia]|uniref:Signal recognition particle receptor FtsY n=2 Tax=Gordonia alkanivorans TaxID=84096 RepID=F9VT33_9ACTN|nr:MULTISPECIES: signal recognition particle-docking protein FtsY [Gordonia]ETA08068.1 cell division protein FtsY [Gordonia alkanivorans CGMCC 6845]MDH3006322.1 signal recognition particle-docking protein FtsY [Gordonia alkanivorans]MDH3009637.1 signal recognition particle-docking protein FtsY [Gordonia alkanivorans]MDH3014080.1 signal recognition particle-docking protein FtsY [Gordonia alkanivorans]MDH3042614.1 signal recognition particle-docking protein FtsY [Gordonia alkanivorans]
MNTGIIIGIVIAVVVIAALIVLGLVLARRRRISLSDTTTQPEIVDGTTRQVDRSGGYQAGSGFSFSRGDTALAEPPARKPEPPREPEPQPKPEAPVQPVAERTDVDGQPAIGDDAAVPRDSHRRGITEVSLPDVIEPAEAEPEAAQPETTQPETTEPETTEPEALAAEPETAAPEAAQAPAVEEPVVEEPVVETPDDASGAVAAPPREEIAPTAGRLGKLRGRLSRSQGAIGKSVLGLLGAGDLDEDSWEEIEDTLLMADLGTATTMTVVENLRTELAANPVKNAGEARALLKRVLVEQLDPTLDRSIRALPHAGRPAVVLVVGVNGTGKTTTTGKLARVLVADGRRVLLGAADTFRAAAADQLQTWGERVGAEIVRGKEQADPAAVAFDAVDRGIATGVDVVMIDTAGRLHTKTGLMDELGKVKRVVEKKAPVDEVLLVLDATVGQNGLMQARVFAEVVDITGVVLTKLDGTAKGGIVFHVQKELGVPVKLVGLGEGADDLAPFEPEAFVDALL